MCPTQGESTLFLHLEIELSIMTSGRVLSAGVVSGIHVGPIQYESGHPSEQINVFLPFLNVF